MTGGPFSFIQKEREPLSARNKSQGETTEELGRNVTVPLGAKQERGGDKRENAYFSVPRLSNPEKGRQGKNVLARAFGRVFRISGEAMAVFSGVFRPRGAKAREFLFGASANA
jgi:hypothetical protein